jgi:MafB19-like deaminase
MADDLDSSDYQRCRNSAYLHAWGRLNECEEKLCRANAFDTFGPYLYNSLGQMGERWGLSSRVARVERALDGARQQAWQQISDRFASLNIGIIWPILINLASDIALYVGGGAASGAALGATVGFFFAGIGAIPGALAGASIGTSAGLGLLNWIGIASLAKDLAHAIPQAIGCYIDGIKTAWGPEPERSWRSGGFGVAPTASNGSDSHLVFQASHQIAQGHVILIAAILMAIMAYVTRGKGADKAALLTEMRNSPRLGLKMADWVQANEAQFPQAMAAMESRAAGRGGGGGSKAASEAQTPNQAVGKSKEEPTPSKSKLLSPQEKLAAKRKELGLPPAGAAGDDATVALLKVGNQEFYGLNGSVQNPKNPFTAGPINNITKFHAEGNAVQNAIDAGAKGMGKEAEMWVDRALCGACGQSNGIGSLAKGLGVDQITVHSPTGAQVFFPKN